MEIVPGPLPTFFVAIRIIATIIIGLFALAGLLFFLGHAYSIDASDKKQKKAQEEWDSKAGEREEQKRLALQKKEDEEKEKQAQILPDSVWYSFHVKLDSINEPEIQDEIVRIVNLAAVKVAIVAMNQDKKSRGIEIDDRYEWATETYPYVKWDRGDFGKYNSEWTDLRGLCLKILPALKDRVPHFSQFEPLKSYSKKRSTVATKVDVEAK